MANPNPRPREIDPSLLELVAELSALNRPVGEIAERIGKSVRVADRYRQRLGLTKPRKPPPPPEVLEQMEVMLKDGAGYRQVGITFGTDRQRIAHLLPGYALTRAESLERAAMGRTFNQIHATLY